MRQLKLVPLLVLAYTLIACSPQAYQINPNPDVAKKGEQVPESEQEGYMRIVGDLRWDQLTSKAEWMKRFPTCLSSTYRFMGEVHENYALDNNFPLPEGQYEGMTYNQRIECKDFAVGGIPINVNRVEFGANSGTKSKTMTKSVEFSFFDDSQSRAFKASLSQKYDFQTSGYCSKFTCWNLGEDINSSGSIKATPTPYTVSLLDKVKINSSDL